MIHLKLNEIMDYLILILFPNSDIVDVVGTILVNSKGQGLEIFIIIN